MKINGFNRCFSFQFTAMSGLLQYIYISLISTLISAVRGPEKRSRSYSSLSQPFLSICHFIDRSGGSAVSEQHWTRNRDGTTRVQLSHQIAEDCTAVCEGVCAYLKGMGQRFCGQSPDASAVWEEMDESQQSNVASDPDGNGSVTTLIHMGLIHMLY